jgi:HD-GYP domain-containing protein (c-di-GMP phosphodiesterase class II)
MRTTKQEKWSEDVVGEVERAVARAETLQRSDPETALSFVSSALGVADPGSGGLLEARACSLAAFASSHLGDQDRTEVWARRGLSADFEDRALKGKLLAALGISLHQRGSFREANRILGLALRLARRSADPESLVRALANVGIARNEAGRYEEAATYLGAALVGCDRAGEAIAFLEAAAAGARAAADTLTLAHALSEKGRALEAAGRSREAREAIHESLTLATLFGINIVGIRSAALMARYHVDSGDLDGGEALLDQWLPQAAVGDSLRHAELLRLRGRVLALRGRWQEAYHESERAALMERSGGVAAATEASLARSHGDLRKRAKVLTERLEGWSEAVMRSLAILIDARDEVTRAHTDRSATIVRIIGDLLIARSSFPRLGRQQLERIVRLTPLHDVGKVAVPDSVLSKPGRLDPEERRIMQRHALVGREVFLDAAKATHFDPIVALAAEIAGSHHERWDGSGYPEGLAGNDVPLPARIVAVADVYDAIRSTRPYKTAMSHAAAAEYVLANAGFHFDPLVVGAFDGCQERIAALYALD